MIEAIKAWLTDFKEAINYVRDPWGWEHRRRLALHAKFKPRPSIRRMEGDKWLIHPEMERRLSSEERSWFKGRLLVTPFCVEEAPSEGWSDVTVPKARPIRVPFLEQADSHND